MKFIMAAARILEDDFIIREKKTLMHLYLLLIT